MIATNSDMAFIPNNFELDDRLAILTGANMGNELNFVLFYQLTFSRLSFVNFFLFPSKNDLLDIKIELTPENET